MTVKFKTYLKAFVVHYFMIYALTIFATVVICAATNPDVKFGLDYLGKAALFALAADAPLAVFISGGNLEGKRFLLRAALHAVLLESLLMPIGYAIGMWNGSATDGVVFFFAVLAVDVVMFVLNFLSSKLVSYEINVKLKERASRAAPSDDGKASDLAVDNECKERDVGSSD